MSTTAAAMQAAGLSLFGGSMPVLSPTWSEPGGAPGALPSFDAAAMTLTLMNGTWITPCAGLVTPIMGTRPLPVTLISADGAPITESGVLLRPFERARLRLVRLYSQVFEIPGTANPEFVKGLPVRPVPAYFYFKGLVFNDLRPGKVAPGEELGNNGELSIHDEDGFPIDPVATAAMFSELMRVHNVLQHPVDNPVFVSTFQLQQIAALGGSSKVILRLADASGQPYDGAHLSGMTSTSASTGLFSLDAPAAGGNSLDGSIVKDPATGRAGSFPPETRRLLKIGPATTGRLTDGPVSFPSSPLTSTLARDFFSLRVENLTASLLGDRNSAFAGSRAEDPPAIRTNEPVRLLTNGNDVLAGCSTALSGVLSESLSVGQAIQARFALPVDFDFSRWPDFPAAVTTPEAAAELPIALRNELSPAANYFDDGNPQTANVDVILTLSNLPVEAAIRVYPRNFAADATEERGDGAGTIATDDGTARMRLRDPLSLRMPGMPDSAIVLPAGANLRFDLVIVKRSGEARIYGNILVAIGAPDTAGVPEQAENVLGLATRRGVSNAGVLGLGSTGALPSSPLEIALALAGEGTPRDAPRLPTMARRELIAAGIDTAGVATAVLSGGRMSGELHSADSRLGAPGSPGGRESQTAGVFTTGGRLAMDIARMAFRRTTHILDRLPALTEIVWDEPPQLLEPPIDVPAGPDTGTFSAAVLQSIAPFCETPEFQPLSLALDLENLPENFNVIVDIVINALPPSTPGHAQFVSMLNSLKNSPLDESVLERIYSELKRDLVASTFGRRDSQWALDSALSRARHCIYIESPGFSFTTDKPAEPPVPLNARSRDLLKSIDERLRKAPGLRVIICTPKHPDYGPGYEPFAASEVRDRREAILGLHSALEADPVDARVVSFHPIGFPGRPSLIESTTVIVDDAWALVGSSSFRRRGLTFDGGTDVVLVDSDLREHVSPTIRDFRRELMATRLGINQNLNAGVPDADFARLASCKEAAFVVRDRLRAGGQGKIAALWNGRIPGIDQIDPDSIPLQLVNPEGAEVDIGSILALAGIASLGRF